MSWISAADLAKRTGVSRAAVTQAIKKGRIPADAVRRSGGRVLVEEAAGQRAILKRANVPPPVENQAPPPMLPAETAELASLFAWGCAAEPEPQPPDVSHLEREIRRLEFALQCCYEREKKFRKHWRDFREWLLSHGRAGRVERGGLDEPSFLEYLREREGDDQRMWSVSVTCGEIILPKLSPLDGVALACQYPKENDPSRR